MASYGAYVSRVQLSLLVDHAERIVLALDADEAGEKQTKKIYPRLARALPTTIAEYPEGFKDPGELSNDQIEDVFGDF